jgi:radical SAM superfamily enzyme YgiQ (UPF0313 family)
LSAVGIWPPITLLEIAAKLKNLRDIAVIDGEAEGLSFNALVERVILKSPDLIVIQSAIPTVEDDILFSSLLKKRIPSLKTVFIGLSATTMTDWLLKHEAVDYSISGEPHDIICDLIDYISEGKINLSEIPGLGYKCKGRVFVNRRKEKTDNYDYSEFPDRALLDNRKYRLPLTGKQFTIIKVSWGCDFSCSFCTSGAYYGKGWKSRSVENIIQEIRQVKTQQGIENFLFLSDTFNARKEFVKKLASDIILEKLNIQWVSNSRLDLLDEESVSLMQKSGCLLVSLGIESFEEEILKKNKKFISLEDINNGINLLNKYGILTYGYFIFGLEGETRKSIWRSIIKAASSKLDFAIFYSLTPYPGTEYYEKYKNKDWKGYFHGISNIVTYGHLCSLEIRVYRYMALFLFYMRPRRLLLLIKYLFKGKLI